LFDKLKYYLKSFFTLNKNEQQGIVVLLFLILLVIIVNLFLPLFINKKETDFREYKNEIADFRKSRTDFNDSVSRKKEQAVGKLTLEEAQKVLHPFEFDPNTLDKEGWLLMGCLPKQYKQINNYLKKGGRFSKASDLKKIYGISDVEFDVVKDSIVIEGQDKIVAGKVKNVNTPTKRTFNKYSVTELNSCDSAALVNNLQLYPNIAARIIKYRNSLGGFYQKRQLLEVYKFPESYYNKIEKYILVNDSLIEKIDINNVSFKKLLRHPYFDYETVKSIFNNKPKKGRLYYSDFEEMVALCGINDSLSPQMEHYLYFAPPK
jgi:DNA uptake protein ComE-like DNA-binding protein